eukprot:1063043-Amphidinium_carterae.1
MHDTRGSMQSEPGSPFQHFLISMVAARAVLLSFWHAGEVLSRRALCSVTAKVSSTCALSSYSSSSNLAIDQEKPSVAVGEHFQM